MTSAKSSILSASVNVADARSSVLSLSGIVTDDKSDVLNLPGNAADERPTVFSRPKTMTDDTSICCKPFGNGDYRQVKSSMPFGLVLDLGTIYFGMAPKLTVQL